MKSQVDLYEAALTITSTLALLNFFRPSVNDVRIPATQSITLSASTSVMTVSLTTVK